jgi:ATP-dependent exoDNAse (exonuclease V) beta subunit
MTASDELRQATVERATELLARLHRHPLWEEIDTALERYSELPYTFNLGGKLENRVIDLLYRTADGWYLVDFKTDSIQTLSQRENLVNDYNLQVRSYAQVAQLQLKQSVQTRLCFLDNQGKVAIVEV